MAADHYAILVGITMYPALPALHAPEGDARRFGEWLARESGGNVPKENIKFLVTSTFHPPDPRSVRKTRPFPDDFEDLIAELWQKPPRGDGRIGDRLYLYFSGHGFEKDKDTAVYAARAGGNDNSHIPATTWATRIWESGLFKEVVLVLDCCRTLMPQPIDIQAPALNLGSPAGARAATKLYFAYATGNDRKAREIKLQNGECFGGFTSLLLEALENADPSDGANVGDEDVRHTLLAKLESFKRRYAFSGLERPELKMECPGDGSPLIWVKRAAGLKRVLFEVPGAADGSILTLKDQNLRVVRKVELIHEKAETSLANGTYGVELAGTDRGKLFQVAGEEHVQL